MHVYVPAFSDRQTVDRWPMGRWAGWAGPQAVWVGSWEEEAGRGWGRRRGRQGVGGTSLFIDVCCLLPLSIPLPHLSSNCLPASHLPFPPSIISCICITSPLPTHTPLPSPTYHPSQLPSSSMHSFTTSPLFINLEVHTLQSCTIMVGICFDKGW